MTKISRSIIFVFWAVVPIYIFTSFAYGETGQLSKSRYSDPKGYFKIVPPNGWRIQEFPQDARGKVAFFSPESNVDLRVLVNAVDFSTIEELLFQMSDSLGFANRLFALERLSSASRQSSGR